MHKNDEETMQGLLYDISPKLTSRTAVFPGDTPLQQKTLLSFEKNHHLMLSALESTVHLGAHADAPCHYHSDGEDIASRDLRRYLGLCQVLHVSGRAAFSRLVPEDLGAKVITAPRVLFRTDSFPNPDHWSETFNSLSPELISWLAGQGVVTVGIDTPSVDPHDSKALESHQALYQHDVAVLEGLDLSEVPEGEYTLVALPLRLEGFDASPVRAILLPPRMPLI
jgi:arylformamidase